MLEALNNNIIIEPCNSDIKSETGVVLAMSYEDKAFFGKVIKIGNKVEGIKVGDIVYFNKYSATPFPYKTENYILLKDEDVLAIEKDPD